MHTHHYAADDNEQIHVFHSQSARSDWFSKARLTRGHARPLYRDQARSILGEAPLAALSKEYHHYHFVLSPDRRACRHRCEPYWNNDQEPCTHAYCPNPARIRCANCPDRSCHDHVNQLDPRYTADRQQNPDDADPRLSQP